MTSELEPDGRRLLRLLVSFLPEANPDRPQEMLGYKDAHEKLGLSNVRGDWGASLKAQGLDNLAEWTKTTGRPAITGIVVNQETFSPGRGYYSLFDRRDDDWDWWRQQVLASKTYDWSPYLEAEKDPKISTLRDLFEKVLDEYAYSSQESFRAHSLADIIRNELPSKLEPLITDAERYSVQGGPGQGNWATIPWVATFDTLITETVQNGYYIVFLFNGDMSGLHLSLNQGVATVKAQYGSGARAALKARAKDYLTRLGSYVNNLSTGPIDLSETKGDYWGPLYEAGSICSIFYSSDSLPDQGQIEADFRRFMILYSELAARDDRLFFSADVEDDELGLENEDLRNLREHKRIERNRKLAAKVKKIHGTTCQACGFDFEKFYGSLGRGFIEAHHKVPLAILKGQVVSLDPRRDFAVLCSNCHRMIHKTEFVGDVREFQLAYIPKE